MSDEQRMKAAYQEIESALHAADNLIRALPEDWQDRACDSALLWALRSYLPVSRWFKGIWAYTVDPSEYERCNGPVFVAHAQRSEELETLLNAEVIA